MADQAKNNNEFEPEAPPPPEEDLLPMDRPPANPEAEYELIVHVLFDPRCLKDLGNLVPADFSDERHRYIWSAILALRAAGGPISEHVALKTELEKSGKYDLIGYNYLKELWLAQPTNYPVYYADIVRDLSTRRVAIRYSGEEAKQFYNQKRPLSDILAARTDFNAALQSENQGAIVLRTDIDSLEPHPPRNWVVNNLIMEKTLTILYADAGSKKTYISLTLAEAICHGIPWLAYTTQKADVLYFDEENGEDEIDDRLCQVLKGLKCDASGNFHYVSYAGLLLNKPEDCLQIKAMINRTHAKFVVFDSLQDFMTGDENSKEDTQPIFTSLKKISNQTGAAVWVQHHAGKSGDYRGSTVIKGNVDLMLEVKSDDDSNLISFKSKKNRKGTPIRFTAEALWANDAFFLKTSTATIDHPLGKSQQYVIDYLTEHGPTLLSEIMGSADVCSGNAARLAVYNLKTLGRVYRTNPSSSVSDGAIYDLS